jgi:hypothetical protein
MAFLKPGALRRFIPGIRPGRAAGALLLALAAAALTARAEAPAAPEYQVKAVFLFNFAQFVEWPARAFHDAHSPIVIGVLGDDPFGPFLDQAVQGEKIGSHPLVARRFHPGEDPAECQILFISRSESERLGKIIPRLKGAAVLTVGDSDGFIEQGGMVRFVTVKNKIRLKINVEAAKDAGLTISSKLLRPAMIASPGRE